MKKIEICFIVALLSFSAWSKADHPIQATGTNYDHKDISITFNFDSYDNLRGSLPVNAINIVNFGASYLEPFQDENGDHDRIRLCFGTWTDEDRTNCNGREDIVIYTKGPITDHLVKTNPLLPVRRNISITFNFDDDNNLRGSLPVTATNIENFGASNAEICTDKDCLDHYMIRLCFGTWTDKDRVKCNGREDSIIYTQGKDR